MSRMLPITDLRKTNEISELCHKDRKIDDAIQAAENDRVNGGQLVNAREALSELRRKHIKA